MTNAMSDAGVTPADVKYINAHGTGTHHNDLFETRAIKLAFGDEAANLKINSTKSMIGHLLGAAGAVEFITCVKEIQDGFIHKTVGYETPDEEIDLNYCKDSYEEPVEYALSNSLKKLNMRYQIHWDLVDIMQVFCSRRINNLGASRM